MNVKNIILASLLLLAILTIGAVSASDNTTDSEMLDAADDVILDSTDSLDVLADGSYYDDDFYIYVQENYTQGKRDWNSYELVYIASYSQKNSTVNILVDNVEKQSLNVTDGHFSVEFDENGTPHDVCDAFIHPADLGLDYGSYNLKVNVNGNTKIDTQININEKENFTIWLQNPYYCDWEYWNSPSFIVIDSNGLNNGTLEVYVNGTRKLTYAVSNGLFEPIENCSGKSRYIAASDLFDSYGNYNVQIKLTENGATKTLKDENVAVAEFEPTTNPHLEIYFDLYTLVLPADDIAHIYLPREATGTLTISYNNVKDEVISYSKGYATHYMHAWNLNHLGDNLITLKYVGDDFGTLTLNATVLVLPKIVCPSYVSIGDNYTIALTSHNWVNGDLKIYDYTGDVKGELLGSNSITSGYSSVKLSAQKAGLNKLYLDYYDLVVGHYPIIQEVNVVQNTEKVTVNVPNVVKTGSPFNITVYAPDIDFTFAQITLDDGETEFIMFENGVANRNVSNLTTGIHTVRVFYENQYFDGNEWVGDMYLNTFTVDVKNETDVKAETFLTAADVFVLQGDSANLIGTLKDINGNALVNKLLKIYIGPDNYTAITNVSGQVSIPINLTVGDYPAAICFDGDENYNCSIATATVKVYILSTILTCGDVNTACGDLTNLVVNLSDVWGNALENKLINVSVAGTDYTNLTDANGQARFAINLTEGNYTAEVRFAGDIRYSASMKTVNVSVSKLKTCFSSYNFIINPDGMSGMQICLTDYDLNPLYGKQVLITLDGEKYNRTTNYNGIVEITFYISEGNHTGEAVFAGDYRYLGTFTDLSYTFSKVKTEVSSNDVNLVVGKSGKLVATLKDINGDELAKKLISIELDGKSYNKTTDDNGTVNLDIDLPAGVYTAKISFAGDYVYNASSTISKITVDKVKTQLTASNISATYNIGKDLVVTLKDADGKLLVGRNVIVTLNGVTYNRTTDSNGQIKVSSYNLAPKTYTAKIMFEGDDTFLDSSADAKVTINKASPTITAAKKTFKVKTKTKKYTITLKNNKKAVMKNKKVTLKVNKKTYTAKTNSKGTATFKITKLTKKGTYKAVIKYGGDSCYKSASKTVKITVKK